MRQILERILPALLILSLVACGGENKSPVENMTWQEQYDLGVRYLSEGKYEEAILAFTAAIEIDPKQAPAYVGRGDAYVLSGETDENLTAAQADYEQAIAQDETNAEAYLGLADIYIRCGEYDEALEILKQGLEKTSGNQEIVDKIAELKTGNVSDASGKTRKSSHFEDGVLIEYWLYEYDGLGNNTKTTNYDATDTVKGTQVSEYNEQRQEVRMTETDTNGDTRIETYEYDAQGRKIKEMETWTSADDAGSSYTLITYDEEKRTRTDDRYDEKEKLINRFVIEMDEDGVRRKGSQYDVDDNGDLYLDYYVEYIWDEDGTYGGYNLIQVANRDTGKE